MMNQNPVKQVSDAAFDRHNPGFSTTKSQMPKFFPRKNKSFQKHSSVDFQSFNSNIWAHRKRDQDARLQLWLIYGLVGVLSGLVAFFIDIVVDNLVLWKWQICQLVIKDSVAYSLIIFLGISTLFGLVGALLTVYVGPGSVGSGIAELMAYMNGVNYPNFIGLETLFVKIFGTCLAVSAGLCVGKEGPLAHIGANIGQAALYLPFNCLKKFHNEIDKREIACAGAAAGVSAAFGSPIGGSLFVYEISRPSSFWSFDLTWKIFFCSSVSTFVLNILVSLKYGESFHILNGGLVKFGSYNATPYQLSDFPFFAILGICGGLLGSFFNFINYEVNVIRRIYLNSKCKKVCETVLITMLTAFLIFCAPLITRASCEKENSIELQHSEFIQYTCKEGRYNPLATLLLNPEGSTIKAFLNKDAIFDYNPLLLHFLIWYLLTIVTYGTAVPAGLFLPGILIGCSLGRMLTLFIQTNIGATVQIATYGTIGAAAVLGGYSRLSFSLAVIMLETTENVNLFLPIIFALGISFTVGRLFNRSLYANALMFKSVPFLIEQVPYYNEKLKAEAVMSRPVVSLSKKASVLAISDVLRDTPHNGFPVIDTLHGDQRLIGLITRNHLMTILRNIDSVPDCASRTNFLGRENSIQYANTDPNEMTIESDYPEDLDAQSTSRSTQNPDDFVIMDNRKLATIPWEEFTVQFREEPESYDDVAEACEKSRNKVIDLRPYIEARPYTCFQKDSLQKIVSLFRLMNLRHLPVLDERRGSCLTGIITRQDLFQYMKM